MQDVSNLNIRYCVLKIIKTRIAHFHYFMHSLSTSFFSQWHIPRRNALVASLISEEIIRETNKLGFDNETSANELKTRDEALKEMKAEDKRF